nr:hypothetical protein [Tanacetum cinerariifolium]GEX59148.1 hypothetical protein [Tanacetum cinerariifolium]
MKIKMLKSTIRFDSKACDHMVNQNRVLVDNGGWCGLLGSRACCVVDCEDICGGLGVDITEGPDLELTFLISYPIDGGIMRLGRFSRWFPDLVKIRLVVVVFGGALYMRRRHGIGVEPF